MSPSRTVLSGSYYEIGLQMGARLTSLEIPEVDPETLAMAARCEAILSERYPFIVDKVEGMIDGGQLDGRNFKALFYLGDSSSQVGCTNLAVLPSHTKDGDLLVGVNYDWYYAAKAWRELREVEPGGAYRSLRATHHWAGSPDGLNEEGLGIFLSVLPHRDPCAAGLAWHLITDLVLDNCRDVGEAWDLITSVPHLAAFNYLLADAQGQAALAEALPDGVVCREASEGFLLATNHLPGREEDETTLSPAHARRQRKSLARYGRVTELLELADRQIDQGTLEAVLRDHQAPVCRGNHDPLPEDTSFDNVFGTIWSLVVKPGKGQMFLAWGHPCRTDYCKQELGQAEAA
ncbi:MAG: C45 family peptidase [Anaerolineae bacterium]|nr:C45 family peptidase [Anaerolineae bacterium]